MCGGCYAVESLKVFMSQTQATRKQGHKHIAQQIVLRLVCCDMARQEELLLHPINMDGEAAGFPIMLDILDQIWRGSLWLAGCCGCWWLEEWGA